MGIDEQILQMETQLEVTKVMRQIDKTVEEATREGNNTEAVRLLGIKMLLIEKQHGLETLDKYTVEEAV